jgi:small subunit ribosomal protein S3
VGHKVHPNAFRLGVIRGWETNWFASSRDYTKLLHEDLEMRRMIMGRLRNAGIAKIETERSSNAQMTVTIHTAKPGIVIGKGGASVDALREQLEKRFPGNRIRISIQEIKHPEMDATLVAENIASQIERRINHRRAMKQSILRTMRAGAKGIRIAMGGRLRGGEMARREWDRAGRVPLHTLRADIDFGRAEAKTTFGVIGIKCWIYKDLVAPRRRGGGAVEETTAAAPLPPQELPSPGQPGRGRRRPRRTEDGAGSGAPRQPATATASGAGRRPSPERAARSGRPGEESS